MRSSCKIIAVLFATIALNTAYADDRHPVISVGAGVSSELEVVLKVEGGACVDVKIDKGFCLVLARTRGLAVGREKGLSFLDVEFEPIGGEFEITSDGKFKVGSSILTVRARRNTKLDDSYLVRVSAVAVRADYSVALSKQAEIFASVAADVIGMGFARSSLDNRDIRGFSTGGSAEVGARLFNRVTLAFGERFDYQTTSEQFRKFDSDHCKFVVQTDKVTDPVTGEIVLRKRGVTFCDNDVCTQEKQSDGTIRESCRSEPYINASRDQRWMSTTSASLTVDLTRNLQLFALGLFDLHHFYDGNQTTAGKVKDPVTGDVTDGFSSQEVESTQGALSGFIGLSGRF